MPSDPCSTLERGRLFILCSERKVWSGKAFLDFKTYQIKMSMKVWAGSLAGWGHLYQEREQGGQGELGQAGGGG